MSFCEICNEKERKYSCPKCNIQYCSVDCYRAPKHQQCSETFYKECVINEMQNQGDFKSQNEGEHNNIFKMIQRLEEQQEGDEHDEDEWEDLDSDDEVNDDCDDLEQRIAGVDLNNAQAVWEKLNDEERQEFKSIVFNNEIQKLVEKVTPWWHQQLSSQFVEDLDETIEIIANCPKEYKNIPKFDQIFAKDPNPCIIYNIASTLGSYIYLYHYYNADHKSYAFEFVDNFVTICDNLKSNANFNSLSSIFHSISSNCIDSQLPIDDSTTSTLTKDLEKMFKGPSKSRLNAFMISALSESLSIFKEVKKGQNSTKSTEKPENSKNKNFTAEFPFEDSQRDYRHSSDKNIISNCIKKMEFYLSFLKYRYNPEQFPVQF